MGKLKLIILRCLLLLKTVKCHVTPVIVIHGGAGVLLPKNRIDGQIDGVILAARAGYERLLNGASALDAVEAAVISMEKDEFFNAGYGSALNERGEISMEASIMCGATLDVGAVTLIKDFPHPISIARKLLTDSPHNLLGGEGAKLFALEKGFETVAPESFMTDYSIKSLREYLLKHKWNKELKDKDIDNVGTVGAIALDSQGHIAVASSSGGKTGMALGHIGGSSQIGCGLYADDTFGGVSCTGHTGSIVKYCLAHNILKSMESEVDTLKVTENAVNDLTARLNNTVGAIALSKDGEVGIHFTSKAMPWAYIKHDKVYFAMKPNDDVFEEKY